MIEALRHRKAHVHVGWRLGGVVLLAAVATAVAAGGQPAFAADRPAPATNGGSAATQSARHHATHAAKSHKAAAKAGKAAAKAGKVRSGATPSGGASASASAVPANGVHPEAVTPVNVTPGVTDAVVDWADDSGNGALSYTVTVDNGGTGCDDVEVPTVTCTLTGLVADGTAYTATVTSYDATGGAGGSGAVVSGPSTVGPFTVGTPGAPTLTSATLSSGTITVNWSAPSDIGAGIDHYTAKTAPAGASCATSDNSTFTCPIDASGLTPGVAYTVYVVANGVGTSGDSAASNASLPMVPGPPGRPTGVMAVAGDAMATVSWTAPADFAHVDYYTATATPVSGSPPSPPLVCNTPSADYTSCTVTGLTDLTAYTFKVVAHGDGDSAPSAASASVIPLPSSIILIANANGKTVTAENGGNSPLIANRTSTGAWETFDVVQNDDGTISLNAEANGKYVSAEGGGNGPLIANRTSIGAWEKFWVVDEGGGLFALKAMANGMYVTAENGGESSLRARAATVGAWEKFSIAPPA